MGAARVNVPSIVVTGGPMASGSYNDKPADLITVFEAVGAYSAGKMSEDEVHELEKCACPMEQEAVQDCSLQILWLALQKH